MGYKRGGGGLISGWVYKRNKKNVSERRDKTYLSNELKLTYHCILNYIYNTFIVRHNKRRMYFKNIKKETQKKHTYTVDGLINGVLYPGGLISGIIYSLANGWAYIRGGLKVGFTVFARNKISKHSYCTYSQLPLLRTPSGP